MSYGTAQSFRMSKTDLKARPMFHHTRDAIEAHLTIVFTALAVNRYLYHTIGYTLKRLINTLKPLQDITINSTAAPSPPPQNPEKTPEHPQHTGSLNLCKSRAL